MSSVINLMYHDVFIQSCQESGLDVDGVFMYKMNIKLFEGQVEKIVNALKAKEQLLNNVLFTFDDGGSSFYTIIAPILERHGLRGVFFIVTKYIDAPKFLNKYQIKELADRGHIIASHSHTHPENIALLNYEAIVQEWSESCNILSEIIGHKVNIASIPNGYSSKYVEKAASETGIKFLYTSEPTVLERKNGDTTLRGRYVVYGDTTIDELLDIIFRESSRRKMKFRYNILHLAHALLGMHYNIIKTRILNLINKN